MSPILVPTYLAFAARTKVKREHREDLTWCKSSVAITQTNSSAQLREFHQYCVGERWK